MLKQLLEKFRSVIGAMEELNKKCVDKDSNIRSFTEEEQREYDELKKKHDDLRGAIARAEELEESRSTASRVDDEPTTARVEVTRAENHNDKGQYRGFKNIGEQLQAVHRATTQHVIDRRLGEVRAAAGLNEGQGSEGGFLVQSDFIAQLEGSMMESSKIASLCAEIEVGPNSNGTVEPILAETSRVDGSRGAGVQAYWEGEADAATLSKPLWDRLELPLKKLVGLTAITEELLADAIALSSFINQAFGEEFGFKVDAGVVEGDGVGKMQGVLNHAAMNSVAKVGSQAADTVVAGNVTAMFASMHPRGRSRAVWLVNPEVWAQLPLMTIGDQPVFLPPGGLRDVPNEGALLGRPVITAEACPKLGDTGDIIFFDPKMYRIAKKSALQAAQSIHVYFDTFQTAFRFMLRINGAPRVKSALTAYKGNTGFKIAPFVKVADRA